MQVSYHDLKLSVWVTRSVIASSGSSRGAQLNLLGDPQSSRNLLFAFALVSCFKERELKRLCFPGASSGQLRSWMQLCVCCGLCMSHTYDAIQRKQMGYLMTYNIIPFQMIAGRQLPVSLALSWHPPVLNSWGFMNLFQVHDNTHQQSLGSGTLCFHHLFLRLPCPKPYLQWNLSAVTRVAATETVSARDPRETHAGSESSGHHRVWVEADPRDQKSSATGRWWSKDIAQGRARHSTKLSLTLK